MKPRVRPHQPQPIRIPSQAKIRDLVRASRRLCDFQMGEQSEMPVGSLAARINDVKMALVPFQCPDKVRV